MMRLNECFMHVWAMAFYSSRPLIDSFSFRFFFRSYSVILLLLIIFCRDLCRQTYTHTHSNDSVFSESASSLSMVLKVSEIWLGARERARDDETTLFLLTNARVLCGCVAVLCASEVNSIAMAMADRPGRTV